MTMLALRYDFSITTSTPSSSIYQLLLPLYTENNVLTTQQVLDLTLAISDNSPFCSQLGRLLGRGSRAEAYVVAEVVPSTVPLVVKKWHLTILDRVAVINTIIIATNPYEDILMGATLSQYYGQCLHFSYFAGVFKCSQTLNYLIERSSYSLGDVIKGTTPVKLTPDILTELIFEIFITLSILYKYKINHYDLHRYNISIVDYQQTGYYYNGININTVPFLQYNVDNTSYYLPQRGFIFKLLDFDFACKYSDPKIIQYDNYRRNWEEYNILPQWQPGYDWFHVILSIFLFVSSPLANVILQIAMEMLNLGEQRVSTLRETEIFLRNMASINTNRPDSTVYMGDYRKILHSKIFERYRISGNSILVATTYT